MSSFREKQSVWHMGAYVHAVAKNAFNGPREEKHIKSFTRNNQQF